MSWNHFSHAILHTDGDSFFASCEVAQNPALRGKPVVTGKERGIASAMTYEAKARGVKRGMSLFEIRRVCPEAIILPSDYETYSLFSKRMFEIVRRYTPIVEEYSIDECFAQLSGLRRTFRCSYGEIAAKIKHDLQTELGLTFSMGVAPTKVLAKVASKWKKPDGLTIISQNEIESYLCNLPCAKIWGIGENTAAFLEKKGVHTALQFIEKPNWWIMEHLSKPFQEIWLPLPGGMVFKIKNSEKHEYQSISKTRTFTPPSKDRAFVFSQLSKNIENACIKARRHKLVAAKFSFYLKTQEFRYHGFDLKLSHTSALPEELVPLARRYFDEVWQEKILYRATGAVLFELQGAEISQPDLFGGCIKAEGVSLVHQKIDEIALRHGKHTVFLASSLAAMNTPQHDGDRGFKALRKRNLFYGESARRRLNIPLLGEVT